MTPVALTIAGSDPSGGAGVQADLKTFHQFGVYGEAVIALITVQNTMRVERVECLSADLVLQQLRVAIEDIPPAAAKTGALGSAAVVEAVAAADLPCPLVVDPVTMGKHGHPLASEEARLAIKTKLLPRAYLVTPNVSEARELTGREDLRDAARAIHDLGARAVLIKGGHLAGDAVDLLYTGDAWHEFPAVRIDTRHTHGTGCTYSAAITAELARGSDLLTAITRAKAFITAAIQFNPGLGRGCGPVNHFVEVS